MSLTKTILVLLILGVSIEAKPHEVQANNLPESECIRNDWNYQCSFRDLNTTKSNPHFKPTYSGIYVISDVTVQGYHMEVLTDDICDFFSGLTTFRVKSVGLEIINEGALDACTELTRVVIESNKLTTLPSNLLANAPKLFTFEIESNPIDYIEPLWFKNFQGYTLSILMTNVEEFPFDAMVDTDRYFTINTHSNQLRDFPIETLVNKFSTLRRVAFSDNNIKCSRVQEILDFLKTRPEVEVSTAAFRRPREGPVSEVEGIICIP